MNKLVKYGITGLALVGITAGIFIGNTLSKYTNKVSGDGETQIARWSFKVNGETEQFETIKLAETYDKSSLVNGKIAPGAKGSFDLVVDTTGTEVAIKYEVDFKEETNKPTNLFFKVGDKTVDTIEELEDVLTDTINADDTNKVRILTINWEWPYESGTEDIINENDIIDTNDGLHALDYTFEVAITGTQIAPSK